MVALPFYTFRKATKKPPLKRYNPDPQTVGERIRKKRIEGGLLQRDVAVLLNTCEDTVTGWESGRGEPIVSHYPNIITFLGYYPLDHDADTDAGLIERCRHMLGLSYEKLGKLVGVHGTTLTNWGERNAIPSSDSKEQLKQLLAAAQCLPT